MDQVILVDQHDNAIGVEEKLRAHTDGGRLHRAFSIFLVNDRAELLLQRRAEGKYHFGGLWSNSCCSHPRPGEDVMDAGRRRLREELGLEVDLMHLDHFIYEAVDAASGLVERELDHVLIGRFGGTACPDPREVQDLRWMSLAALRADITANSDRYTPWLKAVLERFPDQRLLGLGE